MANGVSENNGLNAELRRRPPTYASIEKSKAQLAKLLEDLKPYGVKSVMAGFEFEIQIPNDQITPDQHAVLLEDAKKRTAEIYGEDSEYLKQMDTLNTRELLYFDLSYLDEKVSGFFERQPFGKFYDNVDRLELAQNAAGLSKALDEREIFMERLCERADSYGLKIVSVNAHFSLSPWDVENVDANTDKSHNLFHHTNPEYETKGKRILEGIARGVYEGFPLINKDGIENFNVIKGKPVGLSLGRYKFLRFDEARLEMRLEGGLHQYDDCFLVSNVALAGAKNGLDGIDAKNTKELSVAGVFALKNTDGFHCIKHLIDSSEVKEDGTLIFNRQYMQGRAHKILKELGVIDDEQAAGIEKGVEFLGFVPEDYTAPIEKFFSNVKVSDDGYKIIWPDKIDIPGRGEVPVNQGVKGMQPDIRYDKFYLEDDYRIGMDGNPVFSDYLSHAFDKDYYQSVIGDHKGYYSVVNQRIKAAENMVRNNPVMAEALCQAMASSKMEPEEQLYFDALRLYLETPTGEEFYARKQEIIERYNNAAGEKGLFGFMKKALCGIFKGAAGNKANEPPKKGLAAANFTSAVTSENSGSNFVVAPSSRNGNYIERKFS